METARATGLTTALTKQRSVGSADFVQGFVQAFAFPTELGVVGVPLWGCDPEADGERAVLPCPRAMMRTPAALPRQAILPWCNSPAHLDPLGGPACGEGSCGLSGEDAPGSAWHVGPRTSQPTCQRRIAVHTGGDPVLSAAELPAARGPACGEQAGLRESGRRRHLSLAERVADSPSAISGTCRTADSALGAPPAGSGVGRLGTPPIAGDGDLGRGTVRLQALLYTQP